MGDFTGDIFDGLQGTMLLLDVWGRWARLDGPGLGCKSPMAALVGNGDQEPPLFDDDYMETVGRAVAQLRPQYDLYEIINMRFKYRMSERELATMNKISRRQVKNRLADAMRAVEHNLQSLEAAA